MSVSLQNATSALETIAPLRLAEAWDNVGLLIEPSEPRPIRRVLLTIDLTAPVVDEAIRTEADLVVAYHPPIFNPIKRIEGKLVPLVERRIAVYSPHTALDSAPGGVSDWLARGLGEVEAVHVFDEGQEIDPAPERCKLVVFVPADHVDTLRDALAEQCGVGQIGDYSHCSFNITGTGTFLGGESTNPTVGESGRLERVDEVRVEMVCDRPFVQRVCDVVRDVHPYEEPAFDLYPLIPEPGKTSAPAKLALLREPVELETLIDRVKSHLGLDRVRVASPPDPAPVSAVAVCPGAGGSAFGGKRRADVYLTGEMRHHDVLAKVDQGAAVILTDHTNTERGYLPTLKQRLQEALGDAVAIDISAVDADPLRIV